MIADISTATGQAARNISKISTHMYVHSQPCQEQFLKNSIREKICPYIYLRPSDKSFVFELTSTLKVKMFVQAESL